MKTAKLLAVLVAAAGVLLAQGTLAQIFPTKPIRFVMPYTPGGGSDILARWGRVVRDSGAQAN